MLESQVPYGYTFDDLLLLPGESKILPSETDLNCVFCRDIHLKIPLISAAMDTVTESQTAVVLAHQGGIGVIHRNLTIEQQAIEVRKVKKSESAMITQPVTIKVTATTGTCRELMQEHSVSGIPVVDDDNRLTGIITRRDLQFGYDVDEPVSSYMTSEGLVTVAEGVSVEDARHLMMQQKIEKLPVVDPNGRLVGMYTIKDIVKQEAHPLASKDDSGRLRVAAAVGTGTDTQDRVLALVNAGVDALIVDTAHGHSHRVIEVVREIRALHPDLALIAGNIATGDAAEALVAAGADAVKVGIGPGSICTTRIVAGVGVPQLTAISEVSKVARKHGIQLIADGGIKFSGDVTKALAAGAHSVMIGSMFAGTEESPGEQILYQGRSYKLYRGMGSQGAMMGQSRDRYFQDHLEKDDSDLKKKLVPEGIEGRVPFRGPLNAILYQLVGGLRAGMGYVGAADLSELYEKGRFVQISTAGLKESHVHDVIVTKEAPNYHAE